LLFERSIIGILPKAPLHPLFESLQHRPESRVIVLNPDGNSDIEKTTAPEEEARRGNCGLVEAEEVRTTLAPKIKILAQRHAFWVALNIREIC